MTYAELLERLTSIDDTDVLTDTVRVFHIDADRLYWDIFDGGMCGDDVMAWETEEDSIDDDGQRAVVRVQLPALEY
jgi:hypothetical protein